MLSLDLEVGTDTWVVGTCLRLKLIPVDSVAIVIRQPHAHQDPGLGEEGPKEHDGYISSATTPPFPSGGANPRANLL